MDTPRTARVPADIYTPAATWNGHIRQEEAKRELEEKQRTERALNENRRNNVDIHRMKRIRRLVGMTIADCAKAIGVSPSTFSNYENFREPMPPQEFNKIMAILKEG